MIRRLYKLRMNYRHVSFPSYMNSLIINKHFLLISILASVPAVKTVFSLPAAVFKGETSSLQLTGLQTVEHL